MMAEQAVEKVLCKVCGADVRDGAVFCYGCGKPVAGTAGVPSLKSEVTHARESDAAPSVSALPIPSPALPPVEALGEAKSDATPAPQNGSNMRTAASLRRLSKRLIRPPTEVVWVKPERPPVLFYVVSLALGLVALLLIVAALYLR